MRLAELIEGRDVGYLFAEPEVLEPRRMRDVEMIDRVAVVIEAGQRRLDGREPAAIHEPALDEQDFEPRACQVSAEDQAVVARADHDAVVGFRCGGHVTRLPF